MAILLIIVAMLTAAFNSASTAWRGGERDVERFQSARAALDLIARDLTQVVVSTNVPFYANYNSLAFVATVNDDTNSVQMAEVVYLPSSTTAPFTLIRRFTTSSGPLGANPGNPNWDFYGNLNTWPTTKDTESPVCENVMSFTAQCYDDAGNPIGANIYQSYWNSTNTASSVWPEVGGINGGTPAMRGIPPSYIDIHLGVIDSRTAGQLISLTNNMAAFTNLARQATRSFNVYVKIPHR